MEVQRPPKYKTHRFVENWIIALNVSVLSFKLTLSKQESKIYLRAIHVYHQIQPRPQDGEPRLQCCRHKLLLQRSRGVRPGHLKGTVNRISKSNHILLKNKWICSPNSFQNLNMNIVTDLFLVNIILSQKVKNKDLVKPIDVARDIYHKIPGKTFHQILSHWNTINIRRADFVFLIDFVSLPFH